MCVSGDGPEKACGSAFSERWPKSPTLSTPMIDVTILRAHQHGTGAIGGLQIRRIVSASMSNHSELDSTRAQIGSQREIFVADTLCGRIKVAALTEPFRKKSTV